MTQAACGGPARAPDSGADPLDLVVEVHEAADDRWQVRYRSSEPISGLRFVRSRARPRARAFVLADDDCRYHEKVRAEGPPGQSVEVILCDTPREVIELGFRSDFRETRSDYRLNIAFSEGSRLLFTGALTALPIVCPPGRCDMDAARLFEGPMRVGWRFSTTPPRKVRVMADTAPGELWWRPTPDRLGEGTYAYFGDIEAVDVGPTTMLLDPGAPEWLADDARRWLGDIIAHYAHDLRAELPTRPLVMLSFHDANMRGRNLKGGTLGPVMQLAAEGYGWRHDHDRGDWFRFLAHEAFHLFNGDAFRRRLGQDDVWLSEGSSELFAQRAAVALGVMPEAEAQRTLVEAANECLLRLGGSAVRTSHDAEVPYRCGMVVHHLVDRAVHQATGGKRSLADVFAAMFARSADGDRTYSTFDYLEAVEQLLGDPGATAAIERWLHGPLDEPVARMQEQLSAAGTPVEIAPLEQATMRAVRSSSFAGFAGMAMRLIGDCDCEDANMSVTARRTYAEFHPSARCHTLRGGLQVSHVNGHPLFTHATEAYASSLMRARAGEPILLTTTDEGTTVVELPCRNAEAARRAPTRLLRLSG